MGQCNRWCW